eukprot:TRINITY_DN36805_c0_g1_i1.p1 TRINITY_DN36805_c0_g1~~TRINITY_DN36805_c0_g1_i1.p1  ORF type:complete len:851 (+),score=223.16 TRINITY_DN36805_c0_g1_i1:62-2554(+)
MAAARLLGLLLLPGALGAECGLKNSLVALTFSNQTGDWRLGAASALDGPSVITPGGPVGLWELQLAVPSGLVGKLSKEATLVGVPSCRMNTAEFKWNLNVDGTVLVVAMTATLPDHARAALVDLTVENPTEGPVSLWAVTITASGISATSSDSVFTPQGYGVTVKAPGNGYAYNGRYPGSPATMQFVAAGGGTASKGAGVYLAAHDPAAHFKGLHVKVSGGLEVAEQGCGYLGSAPVGAPEAGSVSCAAPYLGPTMSGVGSKGAALGVTLVVAGAGLPFRSYAMPFAVAIGVTDPSAELWYGAAEIYRAWAVPHAQWTSRGTVRERKHAFADWYLDTNIWVNSGWQCYDRFNDTQGDPPTVKEHLTAIRERFNSTIALHWYEWQCGFDDLCVANISHRYKFDTQYPDYFPARRGDVFTDVVDDLKEMGVYTFPYINGRIFDTQSHSYLNDDGPSRCVQQYADPKFNLTGDMRLCLEAYGSLELNGKEASFGVADPSVQYWQDKYASHINRLVNENHVSGVYVDQLAAGSPLLDWTRGRKHAVGGGSWWRSGLVGLLDEAHGNTTDPQGNFAPVVTESNAEALMDVVQGYLTLVAFNAPHALSGNGASVLSPAFPAIYGGYFIGFGSIYSHADMALNPDVLAARLAANFVYGVQLGWFSLGGVDHGPMLDHSCGPMGQYDLWMDPKHDSEVEWLRLLASSRGSMQRYFVYGRLVKPVELTPAPAVFYSPKAKIMPHNKGPFPTLYSSVWLSEAGNTTCVFLATPTSATVSASFTIDVRAYGLPSGGSYAVDLVLADGTRTRQTTFKGPTTTLARSVQGRSVEMLEVHQVQG